MTALPGRTCLEYLRLFKEQPFIQFLTWYIVLVEQWSFDDIAEMTIELLDSDRWVGSKMKCSFRFRDGRNVSLIIAQNHDGQWYAAQSMSIYGPSQRRLTRKES